MAVSCDRQAVARLLVGEARGAARAVRAVMSLSDCYARYIVNHINNPLYRVVP